MSNLQGMHVSLRQLRAVFAIYFQDGIAYRASGLIWVLTDAATAVTMPMVWIAAAGASGTIRGFTGGDLVLYYLGMLMLGSFITSHFMWEVAYEIKEGVFSNYLIRPMSFFQFFFMRNLAWRCVRTLIFLPLFFGILLLYRGYLVDPSLNLGWQLWVSIFLGHVLSFTFVMAMGMLALFTQEAQAIFELYYVPMLFLSGQLFPIALLPEWAKSVALFFPFYYTTGVPTEILIGRLSGDQATVAILMQLGWIGLSYFLHRVLWKFGVKHYSGVGM